MPGSQSRDRPIWIRHARTLKVLVALIAPFLMQGAIVKGLMLMPALPDGPMGWAISLWLPLSVIVTVTVGYRLLRRQVPEDPQRNVAITYFVLMVPSLIVLTGYLTWRGSP
jgi:hypothetical protein